MSKSDLIHNEDFQAYQEDLRRRLEGHIRNLHQIITQPIGSREESETKLTRMESTTALIVEVETILGIPVSYQKDGEQAKQMKQKAARTFMDMFRALFARGSVTEK